MKYIVRKEGLSWIVRGSNGHYYAARRTHADAWQFAENVANYARCIRLKRDLARTKQALGRMEGRST